MRELDLTQATAHAILKTLCDRGWASRDPVAKTFALGPALAVVAARTDIARPLTHAARAAALRLSGGVGYAGSVVERFGDSLVITAFEGDGHRAVGSCPATASRTPRHSGSPSPRGTRMTDSENGFAAA